MPRYESRSSLEELTKRRNSRVFKQEQLFTFKHAVLNRINCMVVLKTPDTQTLCFYWDTQEVGFAVGTDYWRFMQHFRPKLPNQPQAYWMNSFDASDLPAVLAFIAAVGGCRKCHPC